VDDSVTKHPLRSLAEGTKATSRGARKWWLQSAIRRMPDSHREYLNSFIFRCRGLISALFFQHAKRLPVSRSPRPLGRIDSIVAPVRQRSEKAAIPDQVAADHPVPQPIRAMLKSWK
jgi:hypothetical protein